MDVAEPPYTATFASLFKNSCTHPTARTQDRRASTTFDHGECKLPLIDLSRLNSSRRGRDECVKEMAEATREWGFFQVTNHGIPREVLERMRGEEKKLFDKPFSEKAREDFLNLSKGSYRWGNPRATCPAQYSWSEALHLTLADASRINQPSSLRSAMKAYGREMERLARELCHLLAENLNVSERYFEENCTEESSFVRMNKYVSCPLSHEVTGLVPHTDSSFLTILYQDGVRGLQLKRDERWIDVEPLPETLVVNIGDLFQALSNGVYKSMEHRVVPPEGAERLSIAFFFCPLPEAVIESFSRPQVYRRFSFREYKEQILRDVELTGDKVGLSRFLLH